MIVEGTIGDGIVEIHATDLNDETDVRIPETGVRQPETEWAIDSKTDRGDRCWTVKRLMISTMSR
jgi:hypothetical protein